MFKQSFFVIGFVLSTSLASAQTTDWTKVHELTLQGIDRFFNLDVDDAERTFDEVIQTAPNDPRGYFFKGVMHYWMYLLNKDQKDFDVFFEISDKVIELCETALEKDENDLVANFYLGGIYGYRGLAHYQNGSMLKAVWDGKKGYGLLKEVVKRKPDMYDAQMGFGFFDYLIGKAPRGLNWILDMIGYRGDVERGLAALKTAAEKGTYTRGEAMFYLSQFSFSEHRYDDAFKYIKLLMEKYPNNGLFLGTYAQFEYRLGKTDYAIEAASKAIAISNQKRLKYGEGFAYAILANCLFAKNDFENAKDNFELYIQKTTNEDNIQNWTYYRLGICHDILGERDKAIAAYRQMKTVKDKDRYWDTHLYRRGQQRMRQPMSDALVLLIKADNELGMKNYDSALVRYKEALGKSGTDIDRQASALYGLAQTYYEKERYTEVINIAQQLLALKPPEEKWLIPHGHFKMGQAYLKLGRKNDARREFQKIADYDDYDYQSSLEGRAEEELEKLKTAS